MEHELPGVLDGVDEPVTVEQLEDVVRRAGQRRRASLVAGAAVLLALGALGGALARGPVDNRPAGFASGEQDPQALPAPAPTFGGGMGPGFHEGWTLSPLFRREANGVAIRAYRASLDSTAATTPAPLIDPACMPPTTTIRGELSNAAAVAVVEVPDVTGESLGVLGTAEFGRDEGEPATWAIVRAPAGTDKVRVKIGDASDTQDVKGGGIAVLAVAGSGGGGIVEGLAADGAVMASQPLASPPDPWMNPACMPPPCVVDVPAGLQDPTKPPATFPPTTTPAEPPLPPGVVGCAMSGPATTVPGMPPPPMGMPVPTSAGATSAGWSAAPGAPMPMTTTTAPPGTTTAPPASTASSIPAP